MSKTDITTDIETNGLLDNDAIDYTKSPYVLKPTFKMHCIVLERHDTKELVAFYDGDKYILDGRRYEESDDKYTYVLEDYEEVEYTHYQLHEFPSYIANLKLGKVIGHNIINFDLLACKLYYKDNNGNSIMDYTIGHELEDGDTWCSNEVDVVDTMVLSKVLNADRFGGHKLENIAKMAKQDMKVNFRDYIPKYDRFNTFAADMLYYNIFDVKANTSVYNYLEWERGLDDWNWDSAICLEKKVADIVTNQEHRGFNFDKGLAEECVTELDELMEERRQRVEPLLPPRKATQAFLKLHTPPCTQVLEKSVSFPKSFLKGNLEVSKTGLSWLEKWGATYDEDTGEVYIKNKDIVLKENYYDKDKGQYTFPFVAFTEKSIGSHMKNFVDKHGGTYNEDNLTVTLYDKEYKLPFTTPLKTEMVATIDDTTHIKDWLVRLGWNPTEYTAKDITLKSGTKIKRDTEDLTKAIDKYVEETFNDCAFMKHRCSHMKARQTPASLKRKITEKAIKYGCKVTTNPSFTVGQEKELCKDLERIAKDFPYVKDVVEYLTYKHRRNSILGGGLEWEDGEEAEKGYIANIRDDGRVSTPADTLGAGTGRMKHRNIVNVPRPSSLYGKKMRQLFKVADDCYKIGADFDSLEARGEGHYCFKFDNEDKAYCNSLTLPQPMDVHSVTSRNISSILGKEFGRTPAKSVKYGLTFGAMAAKIATMLGVDLKTGESIVNAFWDSAKPLADLKKAVENWWKAKGNKKYIQGIDGRKIPTRFLHALLNSLFQSFGAISTKTMVVFYDKLLEEEGLKVDFFADDWKNKEFVQLMIIMHDEVALEESKTRFTFKMFDSEEKALQFAEDDGKIWSEPIKKNGKVYLAYSRSGELIHKAVDMTNKHLKLNIDLTMGYVVGRNWAETH